MKNLEQLSDQAWVLRVKIRSLYESECLGRQSRSTPSARKERLTRINEHAYARFLRRQAKRFS